MVVEMKPCPFCGGPAWMVGTLDGKFFVYHRCDSIAELNMHSVEFDSVREAVAAWNWRVGDGEE